VDTWDEQPFGELVKGEIKEGSDAHKAAYLCAVKLGEDLRAAGHDLEEAKVSPREEDHSLWLNEHNDGAKIWTVTTVVLEPIVATATCTVTQTPTGKHVLDELTWDDLSAHR
jgi:hypothetical protein